MLYNYIAISAISTMMLNEQVLLVIMKTVIPPLLIQSHQPIEWEDQKDDDLLNIVVNLMLLWMGFNSKKMIHRGMQDIPIIKHTTQTVKQLITKPQFNMLIDPSNLVNLACDGYITEIVPYIRDTSNIPSLHLDIINKLISRYAIRDIGLIHLISLIDKLQYTLNDIGCYTDIDSKRIQQALTIVVDNAWVYDANITYCNTCYSNRLILCDRYIILTYCLCDGT